MTDDPDLDEDDEFVEQQFDLVYEQAIRYIECPCHYHAYCLGVGTQSVPGFTFAYVLHAMISEVTEQIEAGDYIPPDGCDPLALNDLLNMNDPTGNAE